MILKAPDATTHVKREISEKMPRESESRYHLRGPAKLPSRYADFQDDNRETRMVTVKTRNSRSINNSPTKPTKTTLPSAKTKASRVDSTSIANTAATGSLSPEINNAYSLTTNGIEETEDYLAPNAIEKRNQRGRQQQSDISDTLKGNLRRLKNVLKLPKARRWVYCELFYSGVDQQLFLDESEFPQLLRETFPNLLCRKLCRPEWRAIRRLIGKPRRCSQVFLDEERTALEQKRAKIRQIYDGTLMNLPPGFNDLPMRLPRPLVVGAKIYARVRSPKDGVYAGTIDAILPDSYRVVFDKEEMIPPMIIKDSEVMSAQAVELLSLSYFLEQNRAAIPSSIMRFGASTTNNFVSPRSKDSSLSHGQQNADLTKKLTKLRDEKVGNFPVRMLVILVKLAKLIEVKKTFIKLLSELNAEAEKMNLITDAYPFSFQERYAQVVVDLETVNRQLQSYLSAINEYNNQLLPQLSELSLTSRPEALRKLSQTHALQIVKHCNNGLNVQNKHALDLVTSLTALFLQIRALGQQSSTPLDLQTLSESLGEIRKQIDPSNAAAFQDYVEVHMKQMHQMMLNNGPVFIENSRS